MVKEMKISPGDINGATYVPCLEGKHTQDEIPSQSNIIHPCILYHIYSDLCGPMQTKSCQGKYYVLTFIDRNAHHVKVKLLVTKSETCKIIIALIECAEVETREWVNFFHCDGGGKFRSKELADYFESKGIHHKETNAYTPQENGVAKHINRTIIEMAQTLLLEGNLPLMYWCFIVIYVVYIINQSPTCTLESKTPMEAYTRNRPLVAHLHIFRCKAYIYIPQEKHQKLDKKTLECVYLGYSEHKKAFILLHQLSEHLIKYRDVYFNESELIEPSRVQIETEAVKNGAKVDILPDQETKTDISTA